MFKEKIIASGVKGKLSLFRVMRQAAVATGCHCLITTILPASSCPVQCSLIERVVEIVGVGEGGEGVREEMVQHMGNVVVREGGIIGREWSPENSSRWWSLITCVCIFGRNIHI